MNELLKSVRNRGGTVVAGLFIGFVLGPSVIGLYLHNLSSIWLMRSRLSASNGVSLARALEFEQLFGDVGQISRTKANYTRLFLASGQWNESVDDSRQALRLSQNDPFLALEFGEGFWREGNIKVAVEFWRETPNLDVFFANQGLAHELSGELTEALSDYRISWAISNEVNSAKSEAYFHFAELLWKSDDISLSIEVCQSLLENDVNVVWVNRLLGLIYYNNLHDFASAERYFREAQRMGPEIDGADLWLGLSVLRQGRPQEAVQIYERGIELHPTDGWLNFELGKSLLSAGGSDEAQHYLRRSIQLFSDGKGYPMYIDDARRLLENATQD